MPNIQTFVRRFLVILAMIEGVATAPAAEWSVTELHYQYGRLDAPGFAGGRSAATSVLTFQHASGWKFGDNFFFIDFLDDSNNDGFNNADYYGELYANLSVRKILSLSFDRLPIADIGVIGGLNIAGDANVKKYLPGIRLSWNVPGFAMFNTDITAYIDDSDGVSSGGAPKEDDSFMIDWNWIYPIVIGDHHFTVEGHVEYIGERKDEFGNEVSDWILGQPQFRYDLGKTLFDTPETLFVGVEWQFWFNKLGDKDTDENAVQALIVWRL